MQSQGITLSKEVFERRTSTGNRLFLFMGGGFAQIFEQVVSIIVKKLSNTNFVASRYFKMRNTSLPVDVHCLKTSLLKLPIFTRATPLVAPKTVNFAPKRNATYMSETPFPNLLSFYPYSQSLYGCSGARGYADVKTKFAGIDRFPFSIRMGLHLAR